MIVTTCEKFTDNKWPYQWLRKKENKLMRSSLSKIAIMVKNGSKVSFSIIDKQ